MDTPDLGAITSLTNAQRAGTQAFQAGQKNETSDFLDRYKTAIGSQESSSAMASRIGNELGLPTLNANANSLQQTMLNLPSTYSKATTGYDVNANQLARVVGTKQAELSPFAENATNQAQQAQKSLDTQMGYNQADQAKELIPYQSEQGLLSERLSRESSMYSQENQQELDGLIAKINAGITLSEGEKNRANQLAISEQNFQNQMKLNSQNASLQPKSNADTSVIEVGGHKKLIDNRTGAVISDLGTSGAGVAAAPNVSTYLKPTTPIPSPSFKPVYGPAF